MAVARHRNFSRAAAELGVLPSALSHVMRALEERLAIRLLNRTTRSVALTEAGQRLLDRIQPAFRDISEALEDLSQLSGRPYGTFRINSGLPSAQIVLLPLVSRFIEENPEVKAEIGALDALVDMVADGIDAGVRFGEILAKDMIAIPISPPLRSAVVASPDFCKQYPIPGHPEELKKITCICQRFPSGQLFRAGRRRAGAAARRPADPQ